MQALLEFLVSVESGSPTLLVMRWVFSSIILYFYVTMIFNMVLLFMVFFVNKSLGVAIRYEFGWLGVRIIPILFFRTSPTEPLKNQ